MKNLIARLLERRIPQYLLVYIGVAWGLMQFTQLIVDVFLFSPHWTKVAIFATLMLWPSYLLVVYRHARPGLDSWGLPEKVGVPANLVLAGAALFFMFRGRGSRRRHDEHHGGGRNREPRRARGPEAGVSQAHGALRLRRRRARRRRLWLTGFVPDAVYIDILGDDFLDPVARNQFVEELRRSGYPQLRNVPLALKREIADDLHANWIFSGTIGKAGEQYTATVSLHAAGDGSRVAEDFYVADDVFDLVDRISADLRKHLEIPKRDNVPDLPAKEYFTSNEAAIPSPTGRR